MSFFIAKPCTAAPRAQEYICSRRDKLPRDRTNRNWENGLRSTLRPRTAEKLRASRSATRARLGNLGPQK